jgi:signal peptide peptidase SppA
MTLPHLAARIFSTPGNVTPLMIHPGKAAAILAGVGHRLLGSRAVMDVPPLRHSARSGMGLLGDPLERNVPDEQALFRVGAVALIPIEGTLIHKGKWVGMDSGETSYEGIHRRVSAARRDPTVRAVVFEVDSCGGEVSGAFDCAEAIHELSAEKPTIAILTDVAYSAGYLLASAAREIVVPATGGAGSIGVVSLHADFSKHLDEEGIKVTIIAAGRHKAEGNPYQALPDDVAEKWQADVEACRVLFADAVGRYRGKRLTAAAAMATEADCFTGAAAVAAGLVDAVGRPTEAFTAFCAEIEGVSPTTEGEV